MKNKNLYEILDVVDNNNNIIGQKNRDEIHKLNLNHRSVHIFVENNLNQFFIQLRSKNKKQFPNKWDTSCAGHLNTGESYLQAAVREIKEELNINADQDNFIELGDIPASNDNGFEFVKVYSLKYSGNIKIAPDEIETGAWFDIEILKNWVTNNPDKFAGGFKNILDIYLKFNKSG